ncbi:Ycf20-like protein [Acorus gramineus]|uniref:Ycf20-like protein n=1 Tax=Acorus gramineus TaxID=55184 RepID=A0AAV9BA92_ACOGR|nr:Ycf20-like protein [Acorus gramineus]
MEEVEIDLRTSSQNLQDDNEQHEVESNLNNEIAKGFKRRGKKTVGGKPQKRWIGALEKGSRGQSSQTQRVSQHASHIAIESPQTFAQGMRAPIVENYDSSQGMTSMTQLLQKGDFGLLNCKATMHPCMGGAAAIHVAAKKVIPSVAGLIVVDVVEIDFPLQKKDEVAHFALCLCFPVEVVPLKDKMRGSFETVKEVWTCTTEINGCTGSEHKIRRWKWNPVFALNTSGGAPDEGGGQENLETEGPGTGQTRLGAIVGAASRQLLEKLNTARKNFPMKIFLLLLGFYTANALATILGQTGDWDVLVAGVVVAAIEGIGMLVYRKPSSMSVGRLRSLLFMVNYWKAGVCLGLFVDAFKLGS